VADAIRDCSRRGSTILDTFAGSGTTIMAAEQLGRRAFCMEIDPAYVDVIIRRWQRFTGRDAVLDGTGRTFGELQVERLAVPETSDGRAKKTA
jgi:DNA modification methylase